MHNTQSRINEKLELVDLRLHQRDDGLWEGQAINVSRDHVSPWKTAGFTVLTEEDAFRYFNGYFYDILN